MKNESELEDDKIKAMNPLASGDQIDF